MKLDRFDLEILDALQSDGRLPTARLAARLGLTTNPTWERVRKLEAQGVLRGYHAELAMEQLAAYLQVIVPVVVESRRAQDCRLFEGAVARIPEIVECWAVDGPVDYMLRVAVARIDAYQAIMEYLLRPEFGIQRYWSYVVTKPVKPFTGLPLTRLVHPRTARPADA